MAESLRNAHQELNNAVDKLYRPLIGDRVDHFFVLYERLIDPGDCESLEVH